MARCGSSLCLVFATVMSFGACRSLDTIFVSRTMYVRPPAKAAAVVVQFGALSSQQQVDCRLLGLVTSTGSVGEVANKGLKDLKRVAAEQGANLIVMTDARGNVLDEQLFYRTLHNPNDVFTLAAWAYGCVQSGA